VEVKIVFEEDQVSKYSEFFKLSRAGVQVKNDTNRYYMHHKVAIIDEYIVLIGSSNWTSSADDKNNENLLVIRSAELAKVFEKEFQRIWAIGR